MDSNKTDIKDGFNSVSKHHLIQTLSASFPELSSHVFQKYGSSSFLIFMQGTSSVFISSEEGVHQRDPLSPALFATAIHPVLKELQKHHPRIHLLAYLDDEFLLGSSEDVLSAFHDFKNSFSALLLDVADHKCKIFCPSATAAAQIPVKFAGCNFLRTPVGTSSYVTSVCCDTAKSGSNLCNQLLKLNDAQTANLLLRKCHVPRLNNLARTVRPDLLVPAIIINDSQTWSTFCCLIGYDSLPDNTWQQISLPINTREFGLTSLAPVSRPAFVAFWAHAAVELPFHFNLYYHPSIVSSNHQMVQLVGFCLNVSQMTCLSAIVCQVLVSCSFSFPNAKLESIQRIFCPVLLQHVMLHD